MTDPVSLTLGVVALAGLFNNAVECFEFVQLGRNFGKNFQISLLKLDNARLRLSRWGKSWGLNDNIQDTQSLKDKVGPENVKQAEALLGQILDLFADAEGLSNNYKSRKKADDPSLMTYDSNAALEPAMVQLHLKMRQLSLQRQSRSGLRQKTKWALYEEKHFKRLIEDIKELVDGLVDLFPASEVVQRSLCTEEVAQMSASEGLPQLRTIATEQDPFLADALTKASGGGGATYNTVFSGDNNQGTQIGQNFGVLTGFTFGKGT